MGAHGRDRRRAADRLRQHRESACSCGRTRGGKSSPCARRSAQAARESRESCSSRAWCWAPPAACSAACSPTLELQVLVAIGPSDLPRLQEIAVHPPVLAFTVAVSLASTLVFGSITALKHALHVDTPVERRRRGASASRERNATRNALVVVQVALALVLVVSAGLMIRSFQALRDVDPGFSDPATIQTATIWTPGVADVDAASSIHAHAARDPRQDRGASGRRFGRLYGRRASDGAVGQQAQRFASKARRGRGG